MQKRQADAASSHLSDQTLAGIRLHHSARHLPSVPAGPVARLGSRDLLALAGNPAQIWQSHDNGESWSSAPLVVSGHRISCSPTGALLVTTKETVVAAFCDLSRKMWTWRDDLKDAPGAVLPTCVMRSTDGGNTWGDLQTLHEDWTGANRDIIETHAGKIVFTSMRMRHHPGRHTVLCYCSDDDGTTWTPSNTIDLGGNGHHGGVTEGTLVELRDGRLLQYIRTNWGMFWQAQSADGGITWHPYGPSGIGASSAPGMLKRLASGRIALVWNRLHAEGQAPPPLKGGDGIWSATPVSNFRQELSISFSEDDCVTWSKPVVVARHEGGDPRHAPEVSYPYVFEFSPGTLWITAHRWGLRMAVDEQNVL